MREGLDFDDVLMVPEIADSTITSRNDVELVCTIKGKYGATVTGIPIIAANMDGVGTIEMMNALAHHKMFTALTKTTSWSEAAMTAGWDYGFVTIGMCEKDLQDVARTKPPRIVIDVANGQMSKFFEYVSRVRDACPDAYIMAGTVATADATERIIASGADVARVGIGSGAVCTTRRMTGCGVPQFTAVQNCACAAQDDWEGYRRIDSGGRVCCDGGCVYPGDVAKAIGGGAQWVMLGSMLAGHDEGGNVKYDYHKRQQYVEFYGMSSHAAQKAHGKETREYRASEGRKVQIPYRGAVGDTVLELLGGLRSACSYCNVHTLEKLRFGPEFIRVTNQLNRSLEKYDHGDYR